MPNEKSSGFEVILLIAVMLGSTALGFSLGVVLNDSVNIYFAPTVDGEIKCNEYNGANTEISEYFDVNNTNGDVDDFNYFYVGQDSRNVYVAVDLVSDTTNSTDNEWFSVWLNTCDQVFGGWNESWYSFRNNGTENFVYDVENNQLKPYASGIMQSYDLWFSNSSTFSSIIDYGSIVGGTWSNTEFTDATSCILQSGIDGTSNKMSVSFSFDIASYFGMIPEYEDVLLASITNAKINLTSALTYAFFPINDHDITSTKVHIDNNGTFNDSPLIFDASAPAYDNNIININSSAFEDGILNFNIELVNNTAWYMTQMFHLWIDSLRIEFDISQSDALYGTSTINSTSVYTLEIGFGKSCNSEIPHRMYELKIKKSTLENYTSDGSLGIFIQGSGLTFNGDDVYYFTAGNQKLWFWFFLIWDNTQPDWSVNYYYVDMSKKR